MVWYVPPLSPITSAASAGKIGLDGEMPDVKSLRIPMRYLANLLTAGDEKPVTLALERMLAMRAYMRAKTIDGVVDEAIAKRVGLEPAQIDEMYQIMAIANYEDRFVIPTAHREVRRRCLRHARLLRLHLRQRLLRRRKRDQSVRLAAQGQEPDGDRVMRDVQGVVRAAELSDRGADRRRAGVSGGARCRKAGAGGAVARPSIC